jgi:periplasmic divalent cation tolerance protein
MSPSRAGPERARGPMRVVLTTYPSRDRAMRAIDGALVRRLAACGNVIAVESRYWWKGRVTTEPEALVVFKTVPERVEALFRFLAERHPYEVPEIVELDVPRAGASYLSYLTSVLERSAPRAPSRRATRPAGRRVRATRAPG